MAEVDEDEEVQHEQVYVQGGPFNITLLPSFKDRKAVVVWDSYLRNNVAAPPILRVYHHGKEFKSGPVYHDPFIEAMVRDSGLQPLMSCYLPYVDKSMITAFVERWQPKTSSFHMSFKEMTNTLDDVSSLLRIPIVGSFFTLRDLSKDGATMILVELLGVAPDDAVAEVYHCRGPSVTFTWLNDAIKDLVKARNLEFVARAYMLRFV